MPHEPCCMTSDGILIIFYVDDIVLAYRKTEHCRAMGLISQLKEHFNISGGEDLQWFLGIEIHRDHIQKLIWLNQSSYIDEIVNSLMDSNQPNETPMHLPNYYPTRDSQHVNQ